ncbi:hypothetical protein TrRE_jg7195 [Triparma retinervis]|uniref:Alcohol dehydrogenase-like C-terminal domain-containing protein n=1 Tax=Triparma retinervis TaxID=2557542 RepID=A0A9W7FE32_9STRA|nr:hypothetical protein TrRE_jg7195 [Triparma retinervis]
MTASSFSYPLTYGYCLVGKVMRAGSESEHLLNATVFSFSPHSTSVTAKASSVIVVPPGIDPYRAIFLPSIETAISLIHDAEVIPGESVGVVGQGLIGLLVTAILKYQRFDVTAFEFIDERQALSAFLGADVVLSPATTEFDDNLDVSIEVSGVGAGLQTAIDRTGDGGRIVIGSLYPKDKVALQLGMDFHRSKKRLVVSQVSTLPSKLQQRWTKERRFDLAWSLIRQLPLERLIGEVMGLDEAQEAFELLSRGERSVVAFDLRRPVK